LSELLFAFGFEGNEDDNFPANRLRIFSRINSSNKSSASSKGSEKTIVSNILISSAGVSDFG
jgi:hypothetical protein